MRKRQRFIIACLIIVGAPVVLLGGLWWLWNSPRFAGWGDLPFDSGQWKAAKSWEPDNVRGKIVRSLLRHHRLTGMTRAEVIQLLGRPDGADDRVYDSMRVSDERAKTAGEFTYVLGMYSGFRIDYDVFDIRFGEDGKVRGWVIRQT